MSRMLVEAAVREANRRADLLREPEILISRADLLREPEPEPEPYESETETEEDTDGQVD